jgi:hypothetical protein
MFANSRSVTSNQTGIHNDLERVVRRHLQSPWQAPIADHDAQAFAQLLHIPAHRDHPFRLNVTACSGRS